MWLEESFVTTTTTTIWSHNKWAKIFLKKVPKFWEFMPIFYYIFERISLQRDYAKIYFQILTLIFAYYNCCIIFPFLAFCVKVPFIRKLLFSMTSHLSFAPSFFLGIHFFHSLSLEKKLFSSLISGEIDFLSISICETS